MDEIASVLEQLARPRLTALEVGNVPVRVTHPERVFWPGEPGYTKRDLLAYLATVSPYVLPHLRDRPLTLKRYPTGLTGKHFYMKHVETELPPFVEHEPVFAEQHQSAGEHLFCNNLPTLLWLGQMGNLELHPWYARRTRDRDARALPTDFRSSLEALEASVLNHPDFMVFDLDPYLYSGREPRGDEPELHHAGYLQTCQAAVWLKEVLDQLRLPAFVKTSGKTGLHIFVPIVRQFDFDTVRKISEQVCRYVLALHPNELTMEWSVARRTGKVFLDHNQNTRGKTLAALYSPRALAGAPVSMALRWSELGQVYPTDFTFLTAPQRLVEVGDVWRGILRRKADLRAAFGEPEQAA
jgi:bifunctional non-homologous end joining protein LigD